MPPETEPPELPPDFPLAEFLRVRALASTRDRLIVDIMGGAAVAGTAWWARPIGWLVLASAGLCLSTYGVWAVAERRLQAGTRDGEKVIEFAWFTTRSVAAGVGVAAFLTFTFALLGLLLGTWIS